MAHVMQKEESNEDGSLQSAFVYVHLLQMYRPHLRTRLLRESRRSGHRGLQWMRSWQEIVSPASRVGDNLRNIPACLKFMFCISTLALKKRRIWIKSSNHTIASTQ